MRNGRIITSDGILQNMEEWRTWEFLPIRYGFQISLCITGLNQKFQFIQQINRLIYCWTQVSFCLWPTVAVCLAVYPIHLIDKRLIRLNTSLFDFNLLIWSEYEHKFSYNVITKNPNIYSFNPKDRSIKNILFWALNQWISK